MELERLEARDIHTLLVCPYIIDTGMFDGALKGPSQTWVTSLVLHLIFPYMSTQSAANSILKAMKERVHFLLIPTVLQYYVILLLRFLPVPLFDWVIAQMGGVHGMEDWSGSHRR